jgi:hypothetical protein
MKRLLMLVTAFGMSAVGGIALTPFFNTNIRFVSAMENQAIEWSIAYTGISIEDIAIAPRTGWLTTDVLSSGGNIPFAYTANYERQLAASGELPTITAKSGHSIERKIQMARSDIQTR